MSSQIATFFAKRFIGDRAGNYFKRDDPYYESTEDTPGGHKSKPRKRGIPPGLSEKDAKILKKVRRRAYRMDRSLTCCCCGFRVGWSAVIGILPVIGDFICMLIALSIIHTCEEVGLPKAIVAQMYSNLMLDFGIGLVPVIGDFADAWFKCNTRNNLLLEKYLREKGATHPAPPVEPTKQSTLRRFFGASPDAPGSHPAGKYAHDADGHPVSSVDDGVVSNSASVPPPVPARGTPANLKPAYAKAGRERDLEAQASQPGTIHYSREG